MIHNQTRLKYQMLLSYIRKSPTLLAYILNPKKVRNFAEQLAYVGDQRQAYHFLVLAHRLGCRMASEAFEGVAFHMAKANRWSPLLSVVTLAKHHTGKSTLRLLNWRTRALIETSQFSLLDDALDFFRRENIEPNRRTFHLIIAGHLQNRNLREARTIMRKMEEAGFQIDSSTHGTVVSATRSLGSDANVQAQAHAALRNAGSPTTTVILNNLIRLRLDDKDIPGASRLLSLFDRSPSLDSREQSGVNSPSNHSSPAFPEETTRAVPNAATFAMLINHMAQQRDLPGAMRILSKMKATEVSPNSATVAALIRAFFAAGDQSSAVACVKSLCNSRQIPSYLFNGLARPSSISTTMTPFPIQIKPDTTIFNALLEGILDSRGLPSGTRVLKIMAAGKVRPDSRTVEIILASFERAKRLSPVTLARLLRSLLTPSIPPHLRHLNIILKSFLQREKISVLHTRAQEETKQPPSRRPFIANFPRGSYRATPDPLDPAGGIHFNCSRLRALLQPIIKSLASRNVRADRATLAMRIRHEATVMADLRTARDVFRHMVARGMHPNKYHFTALMEGYARTGNLDMAKEVMQKSIRDGAKPNAVMFTILIAGFARWGHPAAALQTFRDMVASGVSPDIPSINAVIMGYVLAGDWKTAKFAVMTLWPLTRRPFPPELRGASVGQTVRRMMKKLREPRRGKPLRLNIERRESLLGALKCLHQVWKEVRYPEPRRRIKAFQRP